MEIQDVRGVHIEQAHSYVIALSENLDGCVQVGAENESTASLAARRQSRSICLSARTHLNSLLAELVFLS